MPGETFAHPRDDSLGSLNELALRKKMITDCVTEEDCLCKNPDCIYHTWRYRFKSRKGKPPAATQQEVICMLQLFLQTQALCRRELEPWEVERSLDGCSKSRRLTHSDTVNTLLPHVSISSPVRALDCCGGRNDAIAVMFQAAGCTVLTNDIVHRRIADYHLDAGTAAFLDTFGPLGIDWVVTSPPYDTSCIHIVKNAHAVAPGCVYEGKFIILGAL